MRSLRLMEAAREAARSLLQNYEWHSAHREFFVEFSEQEINQIHKLVTSAEPMFKAIPTNQEGLIHE